MHQWTARSHGPWWAICLSDLRDAVGVGVFCVIVGTAYRYADPKVQVAMRVKAAAERIAPHEDFGPIKDVTVETVRSAIADGTAVLVDTRGLLASSRGGIEGSAHIPHGQLAPRWAVLEAQLRRRQKWTVILFGKDAQDTAPDAMAAEIDARGVGPIVIYRGGWKDWVENGGLIKRL
jgi:rhodanese-related sulfurtransferase